MTASLMASAFTLALSWSVSPVGGADPFRPFPVEWPRDERASSSLVDLSRLLDPPAGKGGFIRSAGGHLVRPDGTRFRIWGVNLSAVSPPPEDAAATAAAIARLGINCVRFHHVDIHGRLLGTRRPAATLDPAKLDRFDHLVSELEKRGISIDLTLQDARAYLPEDGVRDSELLREGKPALFFDPRLQELAREYARELLTHRNPYTGVEYRNDPGVVLVELTSENSLVQAWCAGKLLDDGAPGSELPPSYARALGERFNGWLQANRTPEETARWRAEAGVPPAAPLPRLRPDEPPRASRERFHAEAEFYLGLEREYFDSMAHFLREELQVRQLLVGTSDFDSHRSAYPQLEALAGMDVVDAHDFWHVGGHLRRADGAPRTAGATCTAMVDLPSESTVVALSRAAVSGKPFIVSAFSHPYPGPYSAEGIPLLAAYAAFQDWDGLFPFNFAHFDLREMPPSIWSQFDLAMDPVKLTQLAAGALIFLDGGIQACRRTFVRGMSRDVAIESLRLPPQAGPLFSPGFPTWLPLRHGLRRVLGDGPPAVPPSEDAGSPLESDTGELTWTSGPLRSGLVTVDAGRAQAVVGFHGRAACRTRHLDAASLVPEFFALVLCPLDGRPVARSARMLLTAGARCENTGLEWNETRTATRKWGAEPTRIEPVEGPLVLRALEGAREVRAIPLDGASRALGEPLRASRSGDDWVVPLGRPPTTWYVIEVPR